MTDHKVRPEIQNAGEELVYRIGMFTIVERQVPSSFLWDHLTAGTVPFVRSKAKKNRLCTRNWIPSIPVLRGIAERFANSEARTLLHHQGSQAGERSRQRFCAIRRGFGRLWQIRLPFNITRRPVAEMPCRKDEIGRVISNLTTIRCRLGPLEFPFELIEQVPGISNVDCLGHSLSHGAAYHD